MALKLKEALDKQDQLEINFEEFEMYKRFYFEHVKNRGEESDEDELDDEYLLLQGFDQNGQPIYYDQTTGKNTVKNKNPKNGKAVGF